MTEKVKKIILITLEIVMSLGVILSLLFKLVKVSAYEMISLSENGFGFLDCDSKFVKYPFKWQNAFFGIIMWSILILGAILFVCCLYKLFSVLTNEKSKFMKKETTFVGTFSFILTAIYCVSGILFSLIFKSINYSDINYTESLSISTFCYIPIIILSILYITYVFIYFSGTKEEKTKISNTILELNEETEEIKEKPVKQIIEKQKQVEQEIITTGNAIENLREYKKLLDEKVITQDEYDVIKVSLLNKLK